MPGGAGCRWSSPCPRAVAMAPPSGPTRCPSHPAPSGQGGHGDDAPWAPWGGGARPNGYRPASGRPIACRTVPPCPDGPCPHGHPDARPQPRPRPTNPLGDPAAHRRPRPAEPPPEVRPRARGPAAGGGPLVDFDGGPPTRARACRHGTTTISYRLRSAHARAGLPPAWRRTGRRRPGSGRGPVRWGPRAAPGPEGR